MRKLWLLLVLLIVPCLSGQDVTQTVLLSSGTPSNPCTARKLDIDITNNLLYFCSNAVWTLSGGGGGGSLPTVLISTSGPVTDPGGNTVYQFNNAAGALTFNAPAGSAGLQRCYRNATGKSGVITIQMAASNTVDLNGANSSSAGTLTSSGALADSVCLVSDASNHWYAYVQQGAWAKF